MPRFTIIITLLHIPIILFFSFSLPLGKTPKLVKSNSLPTPDVHQSKIAEGNTSKLTGLISDSKSQNSNETPMLPNALWHFHIQFVSLFFKNTISYLIHSALIFYPSFDFTLRWWAISLIQQNNWSNFKRTSISSWKWPICIPLQLAFSYKECKDVILFVL